MSDPKVRIILEGYVRFRDGRKWRKRYCVLAHSPTTSDAIHLYHEKAYDDFNQYRAGGVTRIPPSISDSSTSYMLPISSTDPSTGSTKSTLSSLARHRTSASAASQLATERANAGLDASSQLASRLNAPRPIDVITGLEIGCHMEKESNIMVLIGRAGVYPIAFERVDEMFSWANRISQIITAQKPHPPLHTDTRLRVTLKQSPDSGKLPIGLQASLHIQHWRICLVGEPSAGCKLICSWPLDVIDDVYWMEARPSVSTVPSFHLTANSSAGKARSGTYIFDVTDNRISELDLAIDRLVAIRLDPSTKPLSSNELDALAAQQRASSSQNGGLITSSYSLSRPRQPTTPLVVTSASDSWSPPVAAASPINYSHLSFSSVAVTPHTTSSSLTAANCCTNYVNCTVPLLLAKSAVVTGACPPNGSHHQLATMSQSQISSHPATNEGAAAVTASYKRHTIGRANGVAAASGGTPSIGRRNQTALPFSWQPPLPPTLPLIPLNSSGCAGHDDNHCLDNPLTSHLAFTANNVYRHRLRQYRRCRCKLSSSSTSSDIPSYRPRANSAEELSNFDRLYYNPDQHRLYHRQRSASSTATDATIPRQYKSVDDLLLASTDPASASQSDADRTSSQPLQSIHTLRKGLNQLVQRLFSRQLSRPGGGVDSSVPSTTASKPPLQRTTITATNNTLTSNTMTILLVNCPRHGPVVEMSPRHVLADSPAPAGKRRFRQQPSSSRRSLSSTGRYHQAKASRELGLIRRLTHSSSSTAKLSNLAYSADHVTTSSSTRCCYQCRVASPDRRMMSCASEPALATTATSPRITTTTLPVSQPAAAYANLLPWQQPRSFTLPPPGDEDSRLSNPSSLSAVRSRTSIVDQSSGPTRLQQPPEPNNTGDFNAYCNLVAVAANTAAGSTTRHAGGRQQLTSSTGSSYVNVTRHQATGPFWRPQSAMTTQQPPLMVHPPQSYAQHLLMASRRHSSSLDDAAFDDEDDQVVTGDLDELEDRPSNGIYDTRHRLDWPAEVQDPSRNYAMLDFRPSPASSSSLLGAVVNWHSTSFGDTPATLTANSSSGGSTVNNNETSVVGLPIPGACSSVVSQQQHDSGVELMMNSERPATSNETASPCNGRRRHCNSLSSDTASTASSSQLKYAHIFSQQQPLSTSNSSSSSGLSPPANSQLTGHQSMTSSTTSGTSTTNEYHQLIDGESTSRVKYIEIDKARTMALNELSMALPDGGKSPRNSNLLGAAPSTSAATVRHSTSSLLTRSKFLSFGKVSSAGGRKKSSRPSTRSSLNGLRR